MPPGLPSHRTVQGHSKSGEECWARPSGVKSGATGKFLIHVKKEDGCLYY